MPSERRVGGKGDSYIGLTLVLIVKTESWPCFPCWDHTAGEIFAGRKTRNRINPSISFPAITWPVNFTSSGSKIIAHNHLGLISKGLHLLPLDKVLPH